MPYLKPWMSQIEQLDQLKKRGLEVTQEDLALAALDRIGYYRLSGYWFPFRERTEKCCPLPVDGQHTYKKGAVDRLALDTFKPGARFNMAVDLYVFDKKLRLLVMDALERIEVALRVDISHFLGRHDPFAYMKPELFHEEFSLNVSSKTGLTNHHIWVERHAKLILRSKESFMKHNKEKYGFPVAIWVACETWDFGTLSNLFAGMKSEDQDTISGKYGISNGRTFSSWLRSLNYLRNVCAHHCRLWNRNIIDQPKKPGPREAPLFETGWNGTHTQARPFLLFCITQHLLSVINPTSSWWHRLKDLLNQFPDLEVLDLNLNGLGVIEGWETWEW